MCTIRIGSWRSIQVILSSNKPHRVAAGHVYIFASLVVGQQAGVRVERSAGGVLAHAQVDRMNVARTAYLGRTSQGHRALTSRGPCVDVVVVVIITGYFRLVLQLIDEVSALFRRSRQEVEYDDFG